MNLEARTPPHDFERPESIGQFLRVWLNNDLLSPESQKHVERYYRRWRRMNAARVCFWYDNQLAEVESILAGYDEPRVLEVGVGTGTECLWFALRGADVTGIDRNRKSTRTASERKQVLETHLGRPLKCRIEAVHFLDFEDERGFDVIWLEQAFHHLEPRDEVVRKLGALLKPGGAIVFQEANAWNPLLQLYLLKYRGVDLVKETHTETGTRYYGKERILTPRTLARHLRGQGIETRSVRYFRVFPAHRFFDAFFALERFLSERLNAGPLVPLFTHYNFVGRKQALPQRAP